MRRAVQGVRPLDSIGRILTLNGRAHRAKKPNQILHFRLDRSVDDLGLPLRERSGHQQVFRRTDRWKPQLDGRPPKPPCRDMEETHSLLHPGSHRPQALDVKIDRPAPNGAASRKRDLGTPKPDKERPQHEKRGSHLTNGVGIRTAGELTVASQHNACRHADDPLAQIGEREQDGADVPQLRDPTEGDRFVSQERGNAGRKRGVLGALDRHNPG